MCDTDADKMSQSLKFVTLCRFSLLCPAVSFHHHFCAVTDISKSFSFPVYVGGDRGGVNAG